MNTDQPSTDVILSAAEERRLSLLAQTGDKEARSKVIMGIYPLLMREAGKIVKWRRQRGVYSGTAEEIAQEGMLHASRYFEKFDPSRGLRFSTYILKGCIDRMRSFVFLKDQLIQLPANSFAKTKTMSDELKGKLAKASYGALSLDEPMEGEKDALGTTFADNGASPDEIAAEVELMRLGTGIIAERMRRLPRRLKLVIELRFFEGRTLREASRVLGVCKERVRQLESVALKRMSKTKATKAG